MKPRDERRLVTALFCDLVGFTPLTERLDAEQVRTLQKEYFESMSAEIVRFGGSVEKFAGDAVLALFGVPTAHGDDAERAVLCAIAMQEAMVSLSDEAARRWQAVLALRVGVNTGDAVSGLLASSGREEYTVTGDVVNTAARLQTAAEPGSIMAGEETMRLARKQVRFGERRELALKGKARAVVAYPVLGRREHLSNDPQANVTPLIGRDHELGILLHAWGRAAAGEGKLVTLVADAGIGKSRLIAEVTGRVSAAGGREVRARCLSYGQDISLSLIADLLRSIAGIQDKDRLEEVRRRLEIVVDATPAGQDPEARAAAVDVLGDVLGIQDGDSVLAEAGAQVRRQVLVKNLRLALLTVGEQAPAVLVLEDLQWIDAASAEVLAELLADVPGLQVLVLASQRPGWTATWSEWAWAERLTLRPLPDEDATALTRSVLGNVPPAADLERYVAERAGGNPFFIEELLHMLGETGGILTEGGIARLVPSAAETLPSTLTEILLARLDALDGETRELVQVASVIGRQFSVDLLAGVMERAAHTLTGPLGTLLRAEITVPVPSSRQGYGFKHITMRDVAYHTLLSERRQELHAAAARTIAALSTDDDPAEIVAYHLSRTEEHAEAATWLERAGDRSAAMYANQTAITHHEEARRRLRLSGAPPEVTARIAGKLGELFRVIAWYDESLEEFETAAEIFESTGDVEGEAAIVAQIGRVHFLRGAPEAAVERIRGVLGRLDDNEDDASPGLIALYMAMVDPLYSLNRFEDALTVAYRALELAREQDDERLAVGAAVRYGLALQGIGRLEEARRVLDEIVPRAESMGDLAALADALMWLGDIAVAQGQPDQGRQWYERAMDAAEMRGDVAGEAALLGRIGRVTAMMGDWDEAGRQYERTVEMVRSISLSYFSAGALLALGEHYLLRGDADAALRYLEEPFIIAEQSGQVGQIPYLHVPLAAWDIWEGRQDEALRRLEPLLQREMFETPADHRAMQIAAEAFLLMGETERATAVSKRGLTQAEGQGNQLARLGWLQIEGAVAAHQGDEVHADELFSEALALAEAMPNLFEVGCILWRRAGLHAGADAREDLLAAQAVFDRLGAQPYSRRVRDSLEPAGV